MPRYIDTTRERQANALPVDDTRIDSICQGQASPFIAYIATICHGHPQTPYPACTIPVIHCRSGPFNHPSST